MAGKKKIALELVAPPRKKNPPRTAYSKENPSPHAFRPGQSGNPGGHPKNDLRLVSKSLRATLPTRAPDAVAEALKIPAGSSWAQCLSQAILLAALNGDMSAMRLLIETTEGIKNRLVFDDDDDDGGTQRRLINVMFVGSDGDGRMAEGQGAQAPTIEG